MISSRLLFRLSQAYFILFASSALAMLKNVTVDDAVLASPVVPHYLPNNSVWAVGNTCTRCLAQPDPSLVFNRTWHDTIYYPLDNYVPEIEISFTGSGLYVFFIIGATSATPLTDLLFLLDNVYVGSFQVIQTPSNTPDYVYNVPVYANGDLEFGPHTMIVQPIIAESAVLMLFDYLIYSTDPSIDNSTATSPSPFISTPSSSKSLAISSSGPHISAIVGGTLGGVAFLFLAVYLSYYIVYKRRHGHRPSTDEGIPFMAPTNYRSASTLPVGNTSVYSSAPARSPSPDFATMMKEIDVRSESLLSTSLGERSLEHSPESP